MILHGISNEDYHARPELSSTQLKRFHESPARFMHSLSNKQARKKVFDVGNLFHCALLERHELAARYYPDTFNRRKDADKARIAEIEDAGMVVIKQEEIDNAVQAAREVESLLRRKVKNYDQGLFEVAIFWTDARTGIEMRQKMDYHQPPSKEYPNGIIYDYKTTLSTEPNKFGRQSYDEGYQISAAHYSAGYMDHYGTKEPPVYILAATEKQRPYMPEYYELDEFVIGHALRQWNEILDRYVQCRIANEWPNHRESTNYLVVPRWLENEVYGDDFGEMEIKYDD